MKYCNLTEQQKERKRTSSRKYKLLHKKELKLKNKLYYLTHKKEIKNKSMQYRKKRIYNKNKQSWYKRNPWYKHLEGARRRCNNPNHKDYFYWGRIGIKCLLSNIDVKHLWFRDKAYLLDKPSLDRIDSKGNYTLNNCQFIEHAENTRKAHIKQK